MEHTLSPGGERGEQGEVTSSQVRNHKHKEGLLRGTKGRKNLNLLKPGISSASGKHSLEVETESLKLVLKER